jgi:hypothetical protein
MFSVREGSMIHGAICESDHPGPGHAKNNEGRIIS